MPGIIVRKNGKELAAVSAEGLNIITVNVQGDVLGESTSNIFVQGGLYGEGENDKHFLWVYDIENTDSDVIEIEFKEKVVTCPQGKTIDEIHPDEIDEHEKAQSINDIFDELSKELPIRNGFSFNIDCPESTIVAKSEKGDFSFNFTVMWRWIRPDELRVSLTSNTLNKIRNQEFGINHFKTNLKYGQKVKIIIQGT